MSGAALAPTTATSALVERYSREQIDLIRDQIARNATDGELALFVRTCERLRLDPFAKQIHFVKRWDSALKRDVGAAQTSIDGFRVVAERTGEYEGQTEPEWCGDDGVWRPVWLHDDPPAAARVGVHRRGLRGPIWGIATYRSFVQTTREGTPAAMWRRMPDVMLLKCAEAQALRKAFPNDLSGIYTDDEIAPDADAPAASGSPAVRELGRALHEVPPAGPGPDPLAAAMAALDECATDADLAAWVTRWSADVERAPDDQRRRDNWTRIKRRARAVTPPVQVPQITRWFGEARALRAAAAASTASAPSRDVIDGERDPLDELESVETGDALLAWGADHAAWLAALEPGSQREREVWAAIAARARAIGDERALADLETRFS